MCSKCVLLTCCHKNAFRNKGVHVDTVVVPLFLDCDWNFVFEGEGVFAGWISGNVNFVRESEEERDHMGSSCYVAPGEALFRMVHLH